MGKKRYTSDGRELQPNEYEFRNSCGNIRYKFQKIINGKQILKTHSDLDELRKIEVPYKNVFDVFNRADKALRKYEETKGTNDSEVITYDSPEFGKIRVIDEEGKVLFCASDVTKVLGYSNVRDAIAKHCRRPCVAKRDAWVVTGKKADGTDALRKTQMSFIPEGDVYRLITHSKLPSAEKFESWVFDEVLPLIRKHGVYVDDELAQKTDEEKLRAIEEAEKEKEYLRKRNEELEKENSELRYSYDIRGDAYKGFNTVSFTQLTYMYDRSVVSYLEESGVITKDDRNNIYPTEQYKDYMTTAVSRAGKKFMVWTALGYCDIVYKILLEQYGLKPIRKLNIF